MTTLLITAFTIGLLGSFHCVGMCGPLALSLPVNSNTLVSKFSGVLLYNAGRIVTYSGFGLIFGAMGKTVAFFGYQQLLSIALGVFILLFVVLPKRFNKAGKSNLVLNGMERLRATIGNLFFKENASSLFAIGMLNGLLPCGLVYMAAAGAVATGEIKSSVLFMAFFGLGTLPIMCSIAFFGNYIGISTRQIIRRVHPYMMTLMACLLILRGMGLGIPYISPLVEKEKLVIHGCCAKP